MSKGTVKLLGKRMFSVISSQKTAEAGAIMKPHKEKQTEVRNVLQQTVDKAAAIAENKDAVLLALWVGSFTGSCPIPRSPVNSMAFVGLPG